MDHGANVGELAANDSGALPCRSTPSFDAASADRTPARRLAIEPDALIGNMTAECYKGSRIMAALTLVTNPGFLLACIFVTIAAPAIGLIRLVRRATRR